MKNKIILALISLTLTLLLGEGLLRLFDPLGMAYFDDLYQLFAGMSEDETAPVLAPGFYDMRVYDATVLEDHTRLVPDTNPGGDCIIAAVGDSQTFGMGVDDAETWVNQLALLFPDVRFINAGVPGYSVDDGLVHMRRFPDVDAFIYLVIHNDVWAEGGDPSLHPGGGMLSKYVTFAVLQASTGQAEYDYPRFNRDIERLEALGNVFIATPHEFEGYPDDLPVLGVERRIISHVDGHGPPGWHQDMASALQPHVEELIEAHCVT